jgi:predicted RNA polymerase sigma factor
MDGREAAERAARTSFGRLVALLASRTRDIAGAEDAAADALVAALEQWPATGVPVNPEGWLFTVARRRLSDRARHEAVRAEAALTLLATTEADAAQAEAGAFPDERLKLLFVCAHPAIDPAAHTPLMLQTVLGLDAGRIASAFLVAPSAMSQRLVRAKVRIRDAGIAFELPERSESAGRLAAVLQAIYAAFTLSAEPSDDGRSDLAAEAIWLARTAVALMPDEPEARGLLALMLHVEARRAARRSGDGGFVRLSDQDVSRWSNELIQEAETELSRAAAFGRPGRFQLEAAIQSVHAGRRVSGRTEWPVVAQLYRALREAAPTVGAAVGEAGARLQCGGAAGALALLDELDPKAVAAYQPYWAVRAEALRRSGRPDEARAAFDVAIGLSEDPSVRRFLEGEKASCR